MASINLFVVLMCIVIGIQGTYLGYIVGVQTSIERRFEMSSKDTGLLLSLYDVGTCARSDFVTDYTI
jgi:predicted MFS family arabinose efflux permease